MSARGFWKTAVRRTIAAAGGIEAVAAALGYSKSHIGRWNCLTDADLPDRDQAIELDELALANGGAAEILRAQARRLDHVLFRLPEGFGDAERVTLQLHAASARFGEIAQTLVDALADGRIDGREEGAIAARVDETLQALVHLRALVIEEEPRSVPVRVAK
jgi:hypothetical protein